ncbi:unnamed protein product [Amoebophrya sp. A25]|nr:unnamed protein product [Amoebophrya sp. A25]|eukprot:GSA25T00001200001.1
MESQNHLKEMREKQERSNIWLSEKQKQDEQEFEEARRKMRQDERESRRKNASVGLAGLDKGETLEAGPVVRKKVGVVFRKVDEKSAAKNEPIGPKGALSIFRRGDTIAKNQRGGGDIKSTENGQRVAPAGETTRERSPRREDSAKAAALLAGYSDSSDDDG